MNLWATWCVPCRRETPYLQSLHGRSALRGLRIVGISVDARGFEDEIRDFVREFQVGYTILHDPDMNSVERFAAPGLPSSFVIDREGTIRHAVLGPVEVGDRAFETALGAVVE